MRDIEPSRGHFDHEIVHYSETEPSKKRKKVECGTYRHTLYLGTYCELVLYVLNFLTPEAHRISEVWEALSVVDSQEVLSPNNTVLIDCSTAQLLNCSTARLVSKGG